MSGFIVDHGVHPPPILNSSYTSTSTMRIASVLTAAAIALCELACAQSANMPPLNILHIVVDDLRPELGAYGHPDRHTPAIDSLGDQGVVFDRAYCQVRVYVFPQTTFLLLSRLSTPKYALCGPSRNSFLSGRRPDQSQGKFRAKRGITLIVRRTKLTRLCSHAPGAVLLPARVGQVACSSA